MVTMLIKNKRGQELAHPLYLIFIFTIVAGGIIGMALVFYGNPYDVRNIESTLLLEKIADCISYGGRIDNTFISNGETIQFDFSKCHLNFSSEEKEYFYRIKIYKLDNLENSFFESRGGNINLEASCSIDEESENLPACVEKSFYSLDNLDNQYLIKILSAVRKLEQNA